MESRTTTTQRIIIWIIAATMLVGTLGAYFAIILQNDEQQNPAQQNQQDTQSNQQSQETELPVDPTAFKVEGTVTELQKVELQAGSGPEVKLGDTIRVHYKGTLAQTGQKFDSSYDRGEPAVFPLQEGGLIKGWTDAIPGMKVGSKSRLVIPSDLAYGAEGRSPIPPNTDLVFEVEILAIVPPEQAEAQ